jgi:hypothetical protein
MVALDAKDGGQLWKTYIIPDPLKMIGKTDGKRNTGTIWRLALVNAHD